MGGLRSSAQMISYELAMTMSVVGVLLTASSFSLRDIINAQASAHGLFGWQGIFSWNIFAGPLPQILGFLCFYVAAVAETNRVPFDLAEAESELVAGFHTEYASFKFAMFFIAEYTSMITVSCLCSILFFGGWLSPFPPSWTFTFYLPSLILIPFGAWVIWDGLRYETIIGKVLLPGIGTAMLAIGGALIFLPALNNFIQGPFWLLSKILTFLFVYVWMRGTLPRFRYDQLMSFGWKLLLPVSLANVVITAGAILWRGY
jgi:NADH-quinone oxidoreductase subunit H